jgi:GDP-L-fucose synthase
MQLDAARHRAATAPMLSHLNVGTGTDVTIRELAGIVREVTGFRGELLFDPSKPDGTPRKLLDVSRMRALGWEARIPLAEGLAATCRWFRENLGTSMLRADRGRTPRSRPGRP